MSSANRSAAGISFVMFDWGDTLMAEDGPAELPMADWPEVRAIDGAHAVLARLAGRHRVALCTNAAVSTRFEIERALSRVGIREFVTDIFCAAEMRLRKSDPDFWRTVLARLRARSDQAVMVGDSLEQDVLAPQRAGIRAVWFNWKGATAPAGLTCPVIHRLDQLPAILESEPVA